MCRRWVLLAAAFAMVLPAALAPAAAPAWTGRTDDRPTEVVGGRAATAGRFPWMVRLSMGCGGSLIGARYVLTAAHCVPESGPTRTIVVVAGTVDLDSRTAVRVRSTEVRRARGFRSATRGEDWAVIRLERPLRLPTLRLASGRGEERGDFTVLGWGSRREGGVVQRRLYAARVPFVDDKRCARSYARAGYRFVRDEMLCAGHFRRGGNDACQGDSGGPLVRRDSAGRWVQVGIVSWGHGCGRPGFPGIYTQVSRFASEIRAVTRG